jgi:hypothetical protein
VSSLSTSPTPTRSNAAKKQSAEYCKISLVTVSDTF